MKYKNRVYCELNESKNSDDDRRKCLTRRCLAFMCICAIILIVFAIVLALILSFVVLKDKDPVIEGTATEMTKTSALPLPSIATTRETSPKTTVTITSTSTTPITNTTTTSSTTSTTTPTTTTTTVTTTTFTSTTVTTTPTTTTTTVTTTTFTSTPVTTTTITTSTTTTLANDSQSSMIPETTIIESLTNTTVTMMPTTLVTDILQTSMELDTIPTTIVVTEKTSTVTDILKSSIEPDTIPTTIIVTEKTSTVTDILKSSVEPDTVFTTVIEPMTTTTSTTTTTTTTSTTTRACIPACSATQSCVNGVCVGSGNLAISLTWSVSGDGDIVVTTPNNKHIYHSNKGPGPATDGGQLDRDDTSGTGPENVFWPSNVTPPTGNYHVCFQQYGLNATILRPITATIEVRKPFYATQTYQKTFTSEGGYKPNTCSPALSTFIVTVTYP